VFSVSQPIFQICDHEEWKFAVRQTSRPTVIIGVDGGFASWIVTSADGNIADDRFVSATSGETFPSVVSSIAEHHTYYAMKNADRYVWVLQ